MVDKLTTLQRNCKFCESETYRHSLRIFTSAREGYLNNSVEIDSHTFDTIYLYVRVSAWFGASSCDMCYNNSRSVKN